LHVLFAPDAASASGRVQVTDESGREVASVAVRDLHQGELQVRFNTAKFHTGKYLLTVKAIDQRSGGENVLKQYPFVLTIKE
jgi:hypothetical protein